METDYDIRHKPLLIGVESKKTAFIANQEELVRQIGLDLYMYASLDNLRNVLAIEYFRTNIKAVILKQNFPQYEHLSKDDASAEEAIGLVKEAMGDSFPIAVVELDGRHNPPARIEGVTYIPKSQIDCLLREFLTRISSAQ